MINLNNMKHILLFSFFVLAISVNSQSYLSYNGDTIDITTLRNSNWTKNNVDSICKNLFTTKERVSINKAIQRAYNRKTLDSLVSGMYTDLDSNLVRSYNLLMSNNINKKFEWCFRMRAVKETLVSNKDSVVIAFMPNGLETNGGFIVIGFLDMYSNTTGKAWIKAFNLKHGWPVDITSIARATENEINQYWK
jgi:hypothetical protein